MVPAMRKWFNENFTQEKYEDFLAQLNSKHPDAIEFRVAETPLFIDKAFTAKIISACEAIIDVITQPNFNAIIRNAIPTNLKVPGNTKQPQFIAFDFGICENDEGELEPQLIEMQGFPSLFAYQLLLEEITQAIYTIPENYTAYLNGLTRETYLHLLKQIIVQDYPTENVVLLELLPHQQKTRIDFYLTQEYIGIPIVCLTELIQKGQKLFYIRDHKEIEIKRIYNRIIFDELQQQSAALIEKGKILFEELAVEWVPHPNWFYKISKYSLPFIQHPFVPQTTFLDEIDTIPTNLENYVLKPLFSFGGQGVIIDVSETDLINIKDPQSWILQRKVKYADVIQTPDLSAKAEIRIFYFWKEGEQRPIATSNLARLSKDKMIGVRYNQDKEWVGSSQCYFEK